MPYKDKTKRKEYMKEYSKKWQKLNPDKVSLRSKKWRTAHPDKYKENITKWLLANQERNKSTHKKYNKQYYQNNKEKINEYNRIWYQDHKGEVKQYQIENKHKYSEYSKKKNLKRYRELGYTPLNYSFKGSEGHHITKEDVIYIPSDLHKSIYHNHNKPKTMNKINILAWNYLEASVL